MGIDSIIKERRTIHSYELEEVPQDTLMKALEMAVYAPNHRLTFPFLFIPVGAETRKKVAEVAVEIKGKELVRRKFESEASLIFFAQKLSHDELIRKEDYATMACAIQNFSLYMWEQGYGTKWSSGDIIRSNKIYEILGINRSEYEVVGMIWAGSYKTQPPAPARPELSSFIRVVP